MNASKQYNAQRESTAIANTQNTARHSVSLPAVSAIHTEAPVQRRIENIASWEDFVMAYLERNGDMPPEMLQASLEAVIAEDHDYNYDDAYTRTQELAAQDADIVNYQTCYIRLADLIPQLRPIQHRPDLVAYNAQAGTITQTPTDEEGSLHYGQDRLESIHDMQVLPPEQREEAVSIFFETIEEDPNVAISTGDGRHRIAVYSAMGIPRIRADVTASQRERLVARGINVSDNDD